MNIFSHSGEISPVLWVIIGCEIGFWVLVFGGLSVRYLLRSPGLSRMILLLVPVLDVVLLAAVALDLNSGAEVSTVHRLAGIYLGVTVAFGHSLIRWADARFAHWFADGPPPPKGPKRGPAALRNEWLNFGRWLVGAAITAAAVLLLSVTVADDRQRSDLAGIFPLLGIVTAIWLVSGPIWAMFEGGGDDDEGRRGRREGGSNGAAPDAGNFTPWTPRSRDDS